MSEAETQDIVGCINHSASALPVIRDFMHSLCDALNEYEHSAKLANKQNPWRQSFDLSQTIMVGILYEYVLLIATKTTLSAEKNLQGLIKATLYNIREYHNELLTH